MKVLHVLGIEKAHSLKMQRYSGINLSRCDCVGNLADAERMIDSGEYTGVYIEGLALPPRECRRIENGMAVARKAKEMGLSLVVMDVALSDEDAEEIRKIADRAITEIGDNEGLRNALKEILGAESNDRE